jgi:hypothetical protein
MNNKPANYRVAHNLVLLTSIYFVITEWYTKVKTKINSKLVTASGVIITY